MGTTAAYDAKLDKLVDLIAGQVLVVSVANGININHVNAWNAEGLAVRSLPWVKHLAAGMAAKVQVAEVEMVDINFPIQKKANFQKSINKRTMAGKKGRAVSG